VVASASLLLAAVLVEGTFRLLEPGLGVSRARIAMLRTLVNEGSRLYAPYPYVNYVARRPAGSEVHPVDWAFDLRPHSEAPRVACLGGSTTYGSYPSFLHTRLERELGTPVEVMNWGVPGWNTLDTMVNYFIDVQDYEPDVVVLHHAINDVLPRTVRGYRTDLAHYRTPWTTPDTNPLERWLVRVSDFYAWTRLRGNALKDLASFTSRSGEPAADPRGDGSWRGFERNLRTVAEHVRQRGGHVVLTTQPFHRARVDALWAELTEQHNEIVRALAAREGYLLVDVERAFAPHAAPEDGDRMFLDRVHLRRNWEKRKADLIAEAILERGWLESWPAPTALASPRGRARAPR